MVVHELKNDISTVRIHDEFLETDPECLIGSASKVISESYKRRSFAKSQKNTAVAPLSGNQPTGTAVLP